MFAYSCCILIPKSSSSSTDTYICIPGLKYLLIRIRSGTKLQHLVFRGSKSLPGPTRQRTHAREGQCLRISRSAVYLARPIFPIPAARVAFSSQRHFSRHYTQFVTGRAHLLLHQQWQFQNPNAAAGRPSDGKICIRRQ
jgi:hypothetical protein